MSVESSTPGIDRNPNSSPLPKELKGHPATLSWTQLRPRGWDSSTLLPMRHEFRLLESGAPSDTFEMDVASLLPKSLPPLNSRICTLLCLKIVMVSEAHRKDGLALAATPPFFHLQKCGIATGLVTGDFVFQGLTCFKCRNSTCRNQNFLFCPGVFCLHARHALALQNFRTRSIWTLVAWCQSLSYSIKCSCYDRCPHLFFFAPVFRATLFTKSALFKFISSSQNTCLDYIGRA